MPSRVFSPPYSRRGRPCSVEFPPMIGRVVARCVCFAAESRLWSTRWRLSGWAKRGVSAPSASALPRYAGSDWRLGLPVCQRNPPGLEINPDFVQRDMRRHRTEPWRQIQRQHGAFPSGFQGSGLRCGGLRLCSYASDRNRAGLRYLPDLRIYAPVY
jgi:hypothetical protein